MPTPVQPFPNLRILAVGCLLNACSGDATGPVDPPPPGFEPRFDVTVTVRYLEVSSREACDGVTLITNEPRDGEFQYRILVEAGDKFSGSTESKDYGSVLGDSYSRMPGELINFPNQDFTIKSLQPGDPWAVTLIASEWDGLERDSRMNHLNAGASFLISGASNVGTFRDRRVPLGDDAECGLTLVFDLSVTMRMVPVP